jgi:hypothetical protein
MTVLSGAYITLNPLPGLFGRAQVVVLECLNCPIVNDVLVHRVVLGSEHCGTTLVPTAERLLVE